MIVDFLLIHVGLIFIYLYIYTLIYWLLIDLLIHFLIYRVSKN